jgi:hypothetical protein
MPKGLQTAPPPFARGTMSGSGAGGAIDGGKRRKRNLAHRLRCS